MGWGREPHQGLGHTKYWAELWESRWREGGKIGPGEGGASIGDSTLPVLSENQQWCQHYIGTDETPLWIEQLQDSWSICCETVIVRALDHTVTKTLLISGGGEKERRRNGLGEQFSCDCLPRMFMATSLISSSRRRKGINNVTDRSSGSISRYVSQQARIIRNWVPGTMLGTSNIILRD